MAFACAARGALEGVGGSAAVLLGAKDLAGIPHVLRWYRTVTHHPAFSSSAGGGGGSTARALPAGGAGAQGQGKQKQKQQQQQKGAKSSPRGGATGAEDAAGATAAAAAAAAAEGTTADAAAAGEEPIPVLGEDGDLKSSASVVQGARRLELAPARFRRKRVRVRELLASGTALVGQKAVVKGWLRTARAASKGALLFLVVDDGSCSETIQVRLVRREAFLPPPPRFPFYVESRMVLFCFHHKLPCSLCV